MTSSSGTDKHLLVGLISDTHGVFDEEVLAHFRGTEAIIHAGDIGNHGGAEATPAAAELLAKHQPDVVVYGHSHTYACEELGGRLYVNPGSAGPARFKLGRSVAILDLPPPGAGERPVVRKISLSAKAPPKLPSSTGRKRRRKG
ncbi:hypothetical protein N2152v2_006165 [Parachlorella kessleri]